MIGKSIMKNSVLEFFSWYSGACGVGERGAGPPSGARISSRGPLRPRGSRGLWAPAPCMQEDPSLLLSLVSRGPSSAWALLRKCCPISCPVINMYKSLDSLGHQAWAELGCLSPRLQHGNSLGAGVVLPTPSLHHGLSGCRQLAQDPAELLGAVAQLLDPVHHVLGGGGGRVLQGSGLGRGHDATQKVTQ